MPRRIRSLVVSIALVGFFAASAPPPARALGTIYVADSDVSYSGACASTTYKTDDGPGGYNSDDDVIRAAIGAAVNTSSVYLCRGTYTFYDLIELPTGTTRLMGEGATKSIISGGGSSRLFESNGSEAFFVSNLTLTNGVSNWAAAIWAEDYSTVNLSGVTISDMVTTNGSGGIFSRYGTVTVDRSIFTNNHDLDDDYWGGGAIGTQEAAVVVTNSTFTDNETDGGGGAIWAPYVTVSGSTFSGNTAQHGGAVHSRSTGNITNSIFQSNSADVGGAVFGEGTSVSVTATLFKANTAIIAGALYAEANTLIRTSDFATNSTTEMYGGAAAVRNAVSLTVENTKFTGNTANDYGGAMNLFNINSVTLRSTTFSGNRALGNEGNGNGGAIDACNIWSFKVYSSTFERNTATGSAGALGLYCDSAPLIVDRSLFSQNRSHSGGGAIVAAMGVMTKNRFLRNETEWFGGAVSFYYVEPGALSASVGNTFTSNSANQIGGVAFICNVPLRSEMERWAAKNSFSSNRAAVDRTRSNYGVITDIC